MSNNPEFLIAYQDSAGGVPILLIHGFPLTSSMWEPQLLALADVSRLIAPDLRGHGNTTATPAPYTMEQLAVDCVNLLDDIGINRPFVVMGLSMGGYIAFEVFRQYPGMVAGLILAGTKATADTEEGQKARDAAATLVHEQGVTALVEQMLPKLLAPSAYQENSDLVDFVREMMLETSVEGALGAIAAMRGRIDSTPTLADIDVPTLILHGADDQIIPLSESQAMHQGIANAQLVIIPRAGHLLNLEQPDLFNEAVRHFLESF
ncbi:MAG: alpha/beta fold hydrolase [Chloroflexi bacterium]|nr:alpha/beta fold hydrolase [Chloroflexota bacterium]MBP8055245.1 alpha/beta fold hydrolase [Chloroflexota bacterium]